MMAKNKSKSLNESAAEAGVKKEDLEKALKLVALMKSMDKSEGEAKPAEAKAEVKAAPVAAKAKVETKPSGNGDKPELPKVTKTYPRRTMMLAICAIAIVFGAGMAIMYVFTTNMVQGFIGIPFLFGGGMGFYYYWSKSKDIQVKYQGDVPKEQVNSLVIYPDAIKFENVANPKGFIWHWIDDGKPYYIYWDNPATKKLDPFNLPDQQYYDPQVFAQKVLSLPCHRKIFQRRQDLIQKLKPFIAAVIGLALWILIITTTGGNAGA